MTSISDYISNFIGDVNRALGGNPSVDTEGNFVERDHRIVSRDESVHRVALCALACVAALFLLPSLLPTIMVLSVAYYLAFHIPTHDNNYPRYVDYFLVVHPPAGGIYRREDPVGYNGRRTDNQYNYSEPYNRNGGLAPRDPRDAVGGGGFARQEPVYPQSGQTMNNSLPPRNNRDQVGGRGSQNPEIISDNRSQTFSRPTLEPRNNRDQVGGRNNNNNDTVNTAPSINVNLERQPNNGGLAQREGRDAVGGRSFQSIVSSVMKR